MDRPRFGVVLGVFGVFGVGLAMMGPDLFWVGAAICYVAGAVTAGRYWADLKPLMFFRLPQVPPWEIAVVLGMIFAEIGVPSYLVWQHVKPNIFFSQGAAGMPKSLSDNDARLRVFQWLPIPFPGNRLAVDVRFENVGQATAIGVQHHGVMEVSDAELPPQVIDSWFNTIKDRLKKAEPVVSYQIPRGDNSQFSTIPYNPSDVQANISDLSSGKYVYIFNVMRYRDDTLRADDYIYTEECRYFRNNALHLCESGHNWSYIQRDQRAPS